MSASVRNQTERSYRQQDAVPTRKVLAGGLAGALTTIVVFILNSYVIGQGVPKITGDIGAALTTVLSFLISYLVPPASKDQIKAD
jgi:hypothetical protein